MLVTGQQMIRGEHSGSILVVAQWVVGRFERGIAGFTNVVTVFFKVFNLVRGQPFTFVVNPAVAYVA
jgi:hypothetical protein